MHLVVPKKGSKERLVELAHKNAALVLTQDMERILLNKGCICYTIFYHDFTWNKRSSCIKLFKKALKLIEGDYEEVTEYLQEKMMQASEKLAFEEAAGFRDLISSVKKMARNTCFYHVSAPLLLKAVESLLQLLLLYMDNFYHP